MEKPYNKKNCSDSFYSKASLELVFDESFEKNGFEEDLPADINEGGIWGSSKPPKRLESQSGSFRS